VLYRAAKRKGKIRVFSEEDFQRIRKALILVPRLKVKGNRTSSPKNKKRKNSMKAIKEGWAFET
jgi:hypothetical protein